MAIRPHARPPACRTAPPASSSQSTSTRPSAGCNERRRSTVHLAARALGCGHCDVRAGLVLQRPLHDVLTRHVAAASLVKRRTATPAMDARAGRGTNAGAVHVSDHDKTGAAGSTQRRPRAASQEDAAQHSDSSRPPLAVDPCQKPPLSWPSRELCASPSTFLLIFNSFQFISCMQDMNGRGKGKRPLHAWAVLTLP